MNDKIQPPEYMSEASKRDWRQLVEENNIDLAASQILETFFDARDRRTQARAVIAEKGAVITDRFGVDKISPWVAIERDSALIMHRAFRLLGFDQEPRGGSEQMSLPYAHSSGNDRSKLLQ